MLPQILHSVDGAECANHRDGEQKNGSQRIEPEPERSARYATRAAPRERGLTEHSVQRGHDASHSARDRAGGTQPGACRSMPKQPCADGADCPTNERDRECRQRAVRDWATTPATGVADSIARMRCMISSDGAPSRNNARSPASRLSLIHISEPT